MLLVSRIFFWDTEVHMRLRLCSGLVVIPFFGLLMASSVIFSSLVKEVVGSWQGGRHHDRAVCGSEAQGFLLPQYGKGVSR